MIVILIGILLFSIFEPDAVSRTTNNFLAGIAFAIVVVVLVVGLICRANQGKRKMEQELQWELTEDKIVQRRTDGTPPVEIPLASIGTLQKYFGWLIVRGTDPRVGIALPPSVEGLGELRDKLTAYRPLHSVGVRMSLRLFGPTAAFLALGTLFFTLHNRAAVLGAGISMLVLYAASSYVLCRRMRRTGQGASFAVAAIVSLLLIAWAVFSRVSGKS